MCFLAILFASAEQVYGNLRKYTFCSGCTFNRCGFPFEKVALFEFQFATKADKTLTSSTKKKVGNPTSVLLA